MFQHIQSSFKWKFASKARFDAKFASFRNIFLNFFFPPFHVLSIFIIFVLIGKDEVFHGLLYLNISAHRCQELHFECSHQNLNRGSWSERGGARRAPTKRGTYEKPLALETTLSIQVHQQKIRNFTFYVFTAKIPNNMERHFNCARKSCVLIPAVVLGILVEDFY